MPPETFPAGSLVGTYQVIRPLSAGGSAQVWVAWDPTLHREVALKVLGAGALGDPDRFARIQQEARVLAQLSHPNILQVIDLVRWEGQPVLVTELLQGRTLRAQLSEGALPPAAALEVARQVASALEAVHRKGIIHRDIKPENLFLTSDSRCKVLDFGLAKALDATDGKVLEETFHTSAGLLQGTVGYLSPEQIGGHPVDGRSDLYALGLVLWELVTGLPPGRGRTALERQIHLMKDGPGPLGSGYPPGLEAVLHRCLQVEPDQRFPDAATLLEALRGVQADGLSVPGLRIPARRRFPRWMMPVALGAMVVGAGLGAGVWALTTRRPGPPSFRRLTFQRGNILRARFGPGGTNVVAGAALDGQTPGLYRINLEDGEVRDLGIPGADILSVSPTGELAVLVKDRFQTSTFGSGTLALVTPGQGAPRLMLDEVTGADWDHAGRELAVTRRLQEGAFVLEYPLGRELYRSARPIASPRFSPDGKDLAFMGTAPLFTLFLRTGGDGQVRILADHLQASDPFIAWLPDGKELLLAGNTQPDWMPPLLAVDREGRTRALARFPLRALVHDVAPDGQVLFEREFFRLDLIWQGPRPDQEQDLSWLDGSQVAALDGVRSRVLFTEIFEAVGQRPVAYLRDLAQPTPGRLGPGTAQDLSADGLWALVLADVGGPRLRLYPTGKGVPRDLDLPGWTPLSARFRPGHQELLILAQRSRGETSLVSLDLATGGVRSLYRGEVMGQAPAPDGHAVALAMASGEVLILQPDQGQARPAGLLGTGTELLGWTADGRDLLVVETGHWPLEIERLQPGAGTRRTLRVLAFRDNRAPARVDRVRMSPDGRVFACSLLRVTQSDLLVAKGLE